MAQSEYDEVAGRVQNCKPDSTAPRVERNGGGGDTLSRGGQMGECDVRVGGARMVTAVACLLELMRRDREALRSVLLQL